MLNEEKYKAARVMLCNRLREIFIEKKLTYEEVANKTGFTVNNVKKMLLGVYSPTLDNFIRLAEAIDVYFFIMDKSDSNNELVNTMKNRWGNISQN